jgi:arsenical pump membrane protein
VVLGALAAVVLAYPIVSWFGGPVWIVATGGALLLLSIGAASGHRPTTIVRHEVHFDTLLFLFAALVLSVGLRHVGVVDRLAPLYDGACTTKIGVVSALGSAVLNNHPMSHLNMFALNQVGAGHMSVLAALVGGDLGPRLFPMGSLAGLLWLEMLRRAGVEISARRFIYVGVAATIPTLIVCLALL